MATATETVGISELIAEADKLEQEYRVKRGEIMARIRDAAGAEVGDFSIGQSTTAAPAASRPPAKRSAATAAPKVAAKKTVTGGGAKKKGTKKSGKVAPTERNYDNELTLPKAIWDALDRESWPTLSDIPADAGGLRAGELKTLLDQEGKWKSSSADPGNQISGQLGKFKKAGKIALGDGRRYYIVAGAELEGPDLDESGAPIA